MTRINCISPELLTDKHLLAEYRELPRVFKLAREGSDIPSSYRMGAGHVKFFFDKLTYLYNRQWCIYAEMVNRGFKPKFIPRSLYDEWAITKCHLWNLWHPETADRAINWQRVITRLWESEA